MVRHNSLVFTLLVGVALLLPFGNGFAAWMTKDFCDRQLEEGEIIMNEKAILTNERFVRVFRDDQELVSGKTVYVPSEVLTVQISDSTGQFVLEASHAEFVGGGCKKKNRVNKNHAVLKMPESGSVNVSIKGGWAMGHQEVHLTPHFLLVAPRRKKASIPGAKSHHRKAMGSATFAKLSKHLDGLLGGVSSKKRASSSAKVAGKVKHGAVDGDKELPSRKQGGHKKGVKVDADFETKEEHDAEHDKAGAGKKKKGHWRRAAKIIEKQLRGAMSNADEASPMWVAAAGVLLLVIVFTCYSCLRANRFRFTSKNRE